MKFDISKRFLKSLFFFLLYLPSILSSRQIETFYGPLEVQEQILLELIDNPAFQRLKDIHQYGVAYYTTHREEYNRYDHSIGVFAILRMKGASLEEQIAGLLHDVSHTAFSHVGDWIFGKEHRDKDYQNSIHPAFLEESGLGEILRNHHFTIAQILPEEKLFPALENSLPNLCADRIDYNLQGAYYQGFITYEEVLLILNDLHFTDNRWVSNYPDLMKKLTRFSLFMTQDCWGSPTNYLTSRWLADAILRGIELGCITIHDIHFGTDQAIWDMLMLQQDPEIQKNMEKVLYSEHYFSMTELIEEADLVIKSKFRGINPWVVFDSTCLRLTEVDPEIHQEFEHLKKTMEQGWRVKLFSSEIFSSIH